MTPVICREPSNLYSRKVQQQQPALQPRTESDEQRDAAAGKPLNSTVFALVMTLFMLSAYTADAIGLENFCPDLEIAVARAMDMEVTAESVFSRLKPLKTEEA